MHFTLNAFVAMLLFAISSMTLADQMQKLAEEEHGVIYANNCEACKVLALELQDRLTETGRSHDVIETG